MLKGTDLAREADPASGLHADVIEAFSQQLLIAFLRRLGGSVEIPVEEIDATGGFVLSFNIVDRVFHFKLQAKS